jgi:segregation and condensation protein A
MYEVKLQVFEGPMDLLLYLIRKNQLDIYDIPISEITEQYLEYLNLMKMLDLEIAGEFLVMAATLIQMKSEALLPAGIIAETDESMMTREELVRQLLEYKKFKNVAVMFSQLEETQHDLYTRPLTGPGLEDLDLKEFRIEVTLFDLLSAFSRILKSLPAEQLAGIREETVTVQQKIAEIMLRLEKQRRIEFTTLFPDNCSRLEIIVTFLAILELVKAKQIIARQSFIFGKIWLYRQEEEKARKPESQKAREPEE